MPVICGVYQRVQFASMSTVAIKVTQGLGRGRRHSEDWEVEHGGRLHPLSSLGFTKYKPR